MRAQAQEEFNSNSGGGTAQSCQQSYDDTQRQIAVAGTLIDANFKKQEIDCNGDPGCRRAAGKEYQAQGRDLAKQRVDASAQYYICREQEAGSGGSATPPGSPGSQQNPLRGYVSNLPGSLSGGNQPPQNLGGGSQPPQTFSGGNQPTSNSGTQPTSKGGMLAPGMLAPPVLQAFKALDAASGGKLSPPVRQALKALDAAAGAAADKLLPGGSQGVQRAGAKTQAIREQLAQEWTQRPGTTDRVTVGQSTVEYPHVFKMIADAWFGNAVGAAAGKFGPEALKAAVQEAKVTLGATAGGAGGTLASRLIGESGAGGSSPRGLGGPSPRLATKGGQLPSNTRAPGNSPPGANGGPSTRLASNGGESPSNPGAPANSPPGAYPSKLSKGVLRASALKDESFPPKTTGNGSPASNGGESPSNPGPPANSSPGGNGSPGQKLASNGGQSPSSVNSSGGGVNGEGGSGGGSPQQPPPLSGSVGRMGEQFAKDFGSDAAKTPGTETGYGNSSPPSCYAQNACFNTALARARLWATDESYKIQGVLPLGKPNTSMGFRQLAHNFERTGTVPSGKPDMTMTGGEIEQALRQQFGGAAAANNPVYTAVERMAQKQGIPIPVNPNRFKQILSAGQNGNQWLVFIKQQGGGHVFNARIVNNQLQLVDVTRKSGNGWLWFAKPLEGVSLYQLY